MLDFKTLLEVGRSFDDRFAYFLAFNAAVEGNLANIKGDKGGITMYGIASNYNTSVSNAIRKGVFTIQDAAKIYYEKYYLSRSINHVDHSGLAYFLFRANVTGSSTLNLFRKFASVFNKNIQYAPLTSKRGRIGITRSLIYNDIPKLSNDTIDKILKLMLSDLPNFMVELGLYYKSINSSNYSMLDGHLNRLSYDLAIANNYNYYREEIATNAKVQPAKFKTQVAMNTRNELRLPTKASSVYLANLPYRSLRDQVVQQHEIILV